MKSLPYLIDGMDYIPAENWLRCSCGVRIWPDCDMSLASINAAYEAHLRADHPGDPRLTPQSHQRCLEGHESVERSEMQSQCPKNGEAKPCP